MSLRDVLHKSVQRGARLQLDHQRCRIWPADTRATTLAPARKGRDVETEIRYRKGALMALRNAAAIQPGTVR